MMLAVWLVNLPMANSENIQLPSTTGVINAGKSKTSTRFHQISINAGISQPSLTLRGVPLTVDPGGKTDRKTRRLAARGVALKPAVSAKMFF